MPQVLDFYDSSGSEISDSSEEDGEHVVKRKIRRLKKLNIK